jgi:hypothetical protein
MTNISDLEKYYGSSSHDSDQVNQAVWSRGLRIGLYPAYKFFLISDATLLTFKNNVQEFFFHHNDYVYQVVWSWRLWFSLYPAYKIFQLSNATTFDLEKQ